MVKIKRAIALLFILSVVVGCVKDWLPKSKPFFALAIDVAPITSYRDVPGITDEEINAVEALRRQGGRFVYGMMPGTEAYLGKDGETRGYATLLCEWLTGLFGIPFVPGLYTRDGLLAGLESGEVDFTGGLTANDERRQLYFMTDAIAQRSIKYLRLAGSEPLLEIARERLPRYALLEGTTTAADVRLHSIEPFEPVYVSEYEDAYDLLKTGEADAFVAENVAEAFFDVYGDVLATDFLPLVHTPVSLSTQKPELAPIISVVQKALDSGVIYYLNDLYNKGHREYEKHKLSMRLNEEELDFINNNSVIPFAAEHNNYPVSFYNAREKEWQGVCFDTLRELEALTGLKFTVIHGSNTEWYELLEMLEDGRASMISELIRTPAREGRFLWPKSSFLTDRSALISKTEHRYIDINEIFYVKVGLSRDTAHTELFRRWFPYHENIVEYYGTNAALEALARGEVDMVMDSYNMLLHLTHYQELPNYKANIVFDNKFESTFGFNKDEAALCSIIEKALEQIDTEAISEQWLRKTYDYRVKLAQAQTPWIIAAAAALALTLVSLAVTYVKDRKKSRTIAAQAATLAAIYNSIPAMVFTKDFNNVYTSCNSRFEELAGAGKPDIIGRTFSEALSYDDKLLRHIAEIEQKVINENVTVTTEEWLIFPDKSRKPMDVTRAPLIQNGKVVGLLGIAVDITERKSAEEKARRAEIAEESSKAKSSFLATVSHEIRTPMNAILGITEIQLQDETLEPKCKEAFSRIYSSSDLLLSIVNDLLDMSSIDSDKLELVPARYGTASLINDVMNLNSVRFGNKPLEFELQVDENTPRELIGDELRIKQILNNLLSNSFKYTKKGLVKLSVSAEAGNPATLVLRVGDTGHGMTEEQVSKLFDEYSRFNTEANRITEGTGLGIHITRNLVYMMGGEIHVESEPGIGTAITVRLPQEDVGAGVLGREIAENLRRFRKGETALKKAQVIREPMPYGRVLVVDDADLNLYVVKGLLAPYELSVDTADSGFEAIDKIKSGREYDIVFMDYMMPEMDGIEAVKIIRGMGYSRPIVALTADAVSGRAGIFLRNDFDDFISKPVDMRHMDAVLKKLIRDKQPPEVVEAARKERITRKTETKTKTTESPFLDAVKKIGAVNTEIGLSRVSGMEDMYHDILALFHKKLLGECDAMSKFMNASDMKGFSIAVHSMKSQLATIGAMALSGAAQKLETASKDNAADHCAAHFPAFKENLLALHSQLSAVFPGEESEKLTKAAKESGNHAYLLEHIRKAMGAANDFDGDTAVEALTRLQDYEYGEETDALVDNAIGAFNDFDFDTGLEMLGKILRLMV